MNPFQAHNARVNNAAQQAQMHPAALHALIGTSVAASMAPLAGGIVDTTMGDTHGFNSGEIPLNYLIAALGGGVTSAGMVGNEFINQRLDDRFKKSSGTPNTKASAHDADIKAKMKEIHRTKGVEAAQQFYADHKNVGVSGGAEGTYTHQGASKRRLAGNLLSALVGAGVSLPLMLDESY